MPDERDRRWEAPTQPVTPGRAPRPDATPLPDLPPSPPSAFDPPGGDRYVEGGELGRGGMGRVVVARDLTLDRPVAIKHSLADTPDALARFEREVRITARLQHPGIVPIFDAGRDADGQPYYIMRRIDGVPLDRRIAGAGVRDRLALLPGVLGAIDAAAYAHAQGIVHRDIKPANILFGPFGETLLIDWGLARELTDPDHPRAIPTAAADGLTRLGEAYGTPGFMAPEQARGEEVDGRADVYALGATLFYVVAGEPPFAGVGGTAIIDRIADDASPDFARIPPEVPAELTAIVTRALASAAADRYADAGELAADVRRFLAGQLVAAHRYTVGQHVARWIRRHRLAVVIAAAAVVAIAVVSVVSFTRVVAERDGARAARRLAEVRADEQLVERARTLAAVDPTSAVALLRGLRPESTLWPVAREITRAAVAGGVERRLAHHDRFIIAIAASPDGRVASAWSGSTIEILRPDDGTVHTIIGVSANDLAWVDARTLAYTAKDSGAVQAIGTIDVESDVVTPIPGGVELAVAGGAIVVRTADGAVMRTAGPGAAMTPLATGGIDAIATNAAGAIAMLGRDRLIVIGPDGARHDRAVTIPTAIYVVRVSQRGDRIAALTYGAVLEWDVAGDGPARAWPHGTTNLNDVAYGGDVLYTWTNDGAGVVALAGPRPTPSWLVPATPFRLTQSASFAGGVVFATPDGGVAVGDDLGVVALPHRSVDTIAVGVATDGRTAFLGTDDGDLIGLDLAALRPQRVAAPPGGQLLAVDPTTVVATAPGEQTMVAIDIASGARTDLGSIGFEPLVELGPRTIAAVSGTGAPRALVVWDRAGHEQLRVTGVGSVAFGAGLVAGSSAFYAGANGDLIEQPVDPLGPARTLGHFPLDHVDGRDLQDVSSVVRVDDGVVVTAGMPDLINVWFDRDGRRHDLALGLPGMAMAWGRTSDQAWWVDVDYTQLWRVPPTGVAEEIQLGYPIYGVRVEGDRVWAVSRARIYELDLDGHVVRSIANGGGTGWVRDGFVAGSGTGVVVTAVSANVHRQLRISSAVTTALATLDGTVVAGQIGDGEIVVWRDPVPIDPAALRPYLDHLTNARLAIGSEAVSWEP